METRRLRISAILAGAATIAVINVGGTAVAVDPDFRICFDEFPRTPFAAVVYAADVGPISISDLTGGAVADAAALEAASTWDFSSVTGPRAAWQYVPVDGAWSCSVGGACRGFGPGSADLLWVTDSADGARITWALAVGADHLDLQAFASDEGATDELRYCHLEGTRFLTFAAPGACMTAADLPWPTPLECTATIATDDPCGSAQPGLGLIGDIGARPVRAGTMTLPSGHVVDALLFELLPDFDAHLLAGVDCGQNVASVRQYSLMWIVPGYGPMVQIDSSESEQDLTWQTAESALVGHGLLPPLTIEVTATTDDSISVAWDPGAVTDHIDAFVVYWGDQPGAATPPPFSSELRGDFIPASQTSYTIPGLTTGQTLYVSVTAKSHYIDPVSGIETTYESIALPASLGADIDGDGNRDTSYPPEVAAVTGLAVGIDLLRNWLESVRPISPPKASVLPLDAADLHVAGFASGELDPDGTVLDDLGRRLVFYDTEADVALRVVRRPGRRIAIEF